VPVTKQALKIGSLKRGSVALRTASGADRGDELGQLRLVGGVDPG
jgi:hypothetical protein